MCIGVWVGVRVGVRGAVGVGAETLGLEEPPADRAKKQATIRTAKQYTQEEKVETKPKFGQAELNSWRKDWK